MNNQSPSIPTEEVVDMSPFKRMVMTIGTLPTAFTESMTYYEALAYFVKYLEEVTTAVNQNAEATKELQTLFTELKNYVDTYFDNLDVQEEINNKLDEMAESGQLLEIVSAYALKCVTAFSTVQNMIDNDFLANGVIARTMGYYSEGDGGGAYYKISSTISGTANEMDVITLSNNLYATYIPVDKINLKEIGATGVASDNADAYIARGLELASTYNMKLFIPYGDYTLTEELTLDSTITIEGENDGTGYKTSHTNSTNIYDNRDVTDDYLITVSGIATKISNINFIGDRNNKCLYITNASGWDGRYENLVFDKFNQAILCSGNDNFFNRIMVIESGQTINSQVHKYAVEINSIQNQITNSHFEHCRYFIKNTSAQTVVSNTKFEQSTVGIECDSLDSPIYSTTQFTMEGCSCISINKEAYTALRETTTSDVPYFIYMNVGILTDTTIRSGVGSGSAVYNPTVNSCRLIYARNATISNCIFNEITTQQSACDLGETSFTNNICVERPEASNNVGFSIGNNCNVANNKVLGGSVELFPTSAYETAKNFKLNSTYNNLDTYISHVETSTQNNKLNGVNVAANSSITLTLGDQRFADYSVLVRMLIPNVVEFYQMYRILAVNTTNKIVLLEASTNDGANSNITVSVTDQKTITITNNSNVTATIWVSSKILSII